MLLPKLHSDSFCWQRWRQCDVVATFGCSCRTEDLIRSSRNIKKFAIGYINAEHLVCRPKHNHKAVLFLKEEEFFWFHLKNEEFKAIFS
jgi:hypothetical protein